MIHFPIKYCNILDCGTNVLDKEDTKLHYNVYVTAILVRHCSSCQAIVMHEVMCKQRQLNAKRNLSLQLRMDITSSLPIFL